MSIRAQIDRYESDAAAPGRAIAGLTDAELKAFPVPGTWSIQQLVMHLMDSDVIASDRMKRIIAQDNPLIAAYDETAFSKNLFYDKLDAKLACQIFEQNRRMTAALLRLLPESAFQRAGNHTERGRLTLADILQMYVDHVPHHMKFLHAKRAALGKAV